MTNIRLSNENLDRMDAIREYFKDLEPISVDLSPTNVVTMALRDLCAVVTSTGFSNDDAAALDPVAVVSEDGPEG